jgi:hypothetical protein
MSDLPEAEIIKKLHTGLGIRREGLNANLSSMGLERVKLGAAQRVCPELCSFYVIQLAWDHGKDPREAIGKLRQSNPEYSNTKKIDTLLENAEKFMRWGVV